MNPDIHTPFASYDDAINRLIPYHLLLSNVNQFQTPHSFIPENVFKILDRATNKITRSDDSEYNYSTFLNLKCIFESRRMANSKIGAKPGAIASAAVLPQAKHSSYSHAQSSFHPSPTQYIAPSAGGGHSYAQKPTMPYHTSVPMAGFAQHAFYGPPVSAAPQGYMIPSNFQGYSHGFVPKGIHQMQSNVSPPQMSHPQQFHPYGFAPQSTTPVPYYLPQFSQQHIFNNYSSIGGPVPPKHVPNDGFESGSSSSSSSSVKRPSN